MSSTKRSERSSGAQTILEKALGPQHADTVGMIMNLGVVGDYDGASALFERALPLWENQTASVS